MRKVVSTTVFALLIVLVLLVEFLPVRTQAQGGYRAAQTGLYVGNGTTTQVVTVCPGPRSLRIVHLPDRGPASEAYTTNQFGWAGVFLNGNKKDTGLTLDAGSFTVTNIDFNENGAVYFWEVVGDCFY